jgi:hypothetical protein
VTDTDFTCEAAAAAKLRAWFKAESPLVMNKENLDDVQTVLADYERVLAENARMRQDLEHHGVGKYYRLPDGGGYCVSCRRPMREGGLVVRVTAPKCLLCIGEAAPELHASCAHPAYEYATTQGQRKAFDRIDEPPEGDGWERNVDAGRNGWERFDYHEESYWRRLRASASTQQARGEGIGHV